MLALLEKLKGFDPRLFYLAITGVVFLFIYAWRKLHYASWDAITRQNPKVQQLPALLLSAFLSSMPSWGKEIWTVLTDTVVGVLVGGGGSILLHHVLKAAPAVPYQGGKPKAMPPGA